MTQHDDVTSTTTGPNKQQDLHQAVAELQQAVGDLQHAPERSVPPPPVSSSGRAAIP